MRRLTGIRASDVFEIGEKIQHVSGTGPIYEIVSLDRLDGTAGASNANELIVVINPDNWKKV